MTVIEEKQTNLLVFLFLKPIHNRSKKQELLMQFYFLVELKNLAPTISEHSC